MGTSLEKVVPWPSLLKTETSTGGFYPFSIKNEKLYQLIDNENTDEWELHVTDIQ